MIKVEELFRMINEKKYIGVIDLLTAAKISVGDIKSIQQEGATHKDLIPILLQPIRNNIEALCNPFWHDGSEYNLPKLIFMLWELSQNKEEKIQLALILKLMVAIVFPDIEGVENGTNETLVKIKNGEIKTVKNVPTLLFGSHSKYGSSGDFSEVRLYIGGDEEQLFFTQDQDNKQEKGVCSPCCLI